MSLPGGCMAENDFARSHRPSWTPPSPITSELDALRSFKAEWKRRSSVLPTYDGYKSTRELLYVEVEDFEIYRSADSGRRDQFELTSLHLEVPLSQRLCFDGYVCVGNVKHYVQAVAIQDSSIEGFGDTNTPGVTTYVQSKLASKDSGYDIWYKLKQPSLEYNRFHRPFLWVAQLSKHVIDYLEAQPAQSVGLANFRIDFHRWLIPRFPQSKRFQRWHRSFNNQVDFRVGLNAYINYIYQQASSLPNSKQLLGHPLWGECLAAKGLASIKQQEDTEKYTIATHHVFESFRDMYFANQIKGMKASKHVRAAQELRKRKLGFPKVLSASATASQSPPLCQPYGKSSIKVGDIIALDPDEEDRKVWKNAADEWLAYVQGVTLLDNGTQRLSILWLYRPRDTNISSARYPFSNELFLSDNCNCSDGELLSTNVKGRYGIDWSPTTIDPNKGFFIRQTYITQDSAFVTCQAEHKTCSCTKLKRLPVDTYQPGDTAYVTTRVGNKQTILDPVTIQHIHKASSVVTVQKFLRLQDDCADLAKVAYRTNVGCNELVLTEETEQVNALQIKRRCSIRFVEKEDVLKGQIPFGYDRGGAGDLFYLSMRMRTRSNGDRKLEFLKKLPNYIHEGIDLRATRRPLKGLSIFSGGGSLDRGLEEGGAVEFYTAVDKSKTAIHTQLANAQNPSKMRLYCGSVDDFFREALAGTFARLVPLIGEVEIVVGGTPCPGYSALQKDPFSPKSLRNSSHISTFCSYVDHYRPLYGILENVVNMASTRKGIEDQNVLSQLVACLVSMGYQVNQFIMDAWSYNSAQQRSRIILTIAAPRLSPILQPEHTSSKLARDTAAKSLGTLPTGNRYGEREHYPTPFTYVSTGEIISDLPDIGNSIVQTCIPYPDHRLAYVPNGKIRALLEYIPKDPPGCGYKEAHQRGLIPPSLQNSKHESGKGYRRVKEADLVPTITTSVNPHDSHNGACVHYSQDRPISLMDARRTQGYLDDEPIIGNPAQQFEIVGNGVDRKVSFALGLALRRAMDKNDTSDSVDYMTTVEDTTMTTHEDEDDIEDDATDLVYQSTRRAGAKMRSSPSVVIPPRARPNRNFSVSSKPNQTAPIASHELAETSNAPSSLDTAQPSSLAIPKTGVVSPLGRRARDFSVMALQSSSKSSTLSVHGKRSREQSVGEIRAKPESSGGEQSHLGKRVKTSHSLQTLTVAATSTKSTTGTANSRNNAKPSPKSRYTRHSGLKLEFTPKNWHKIPEKER